MKISRLTNDTKLLQNPGDLYNTRLSHQNIIVTSMVCAAGVVVRQRLRRRPLPPICKKQFDINATSTRDHDIDVFERMTGKDAKLEKFCTFL